MSPAWKVELELGSKADLLEIGRLKKVESGKEARAVQLGVLSQNDKTLDAPVNTQKEIAKAAGATCRLLGRLSWSWATRRI